MNFNNFWNILNELYDIKDFNQDVWSDFYHFYSSPSDLLNSLAVRVIYSNKNARDSQLDLLALRSEESDWGLAAARNFAYVCMTKGQEGKLRAIKHLKRPIGLSFDSLKNLCDNRGYIFNPEDEFSQFAAKTQYSKSAKNTPTKVDKNKKVENFRDFRLSAIGIIRIDNEKYYFISGGQGRNLNNHWYSKLFNSESGKHLYTTLKNWFMTNMNLDNQTELNNKKVATKQQMYYYFTDNYIGNETLRFSPTEGPVAGKHFTVNTDGNKNTNYLPWGFIVENGELKALPPTTSSKSNKKRVPAESALNFDLKKASNVVFEEILGVGPILVKDDNEKVLLKMDLVVPGNKGGYTGPQLFSIDKEWQIAKDSALHLSTNKSGDSYQIHLQLGQDDFNTIKELYSESEYRVYVPNKKDLRFSPTDIKTIVLPNIYHNADTEINFRNLMQIIDTFNNRYKLPEDKAEIILELKDKGIIPEDQKNLNDSTINLISGYIRLLQTMYKHLIVEILEVEPDTPQFKKFKAYHIDNDTIDELPASKNNKFKGNDKTRYSVLTDTPEVEIKEGPVPSQVVKPNLATAQPRPWHGIQSIIADINISGQTQKARLGAETIIIGADKNNRKYVLFINNAHKTEGFFELPGGGLYNKPTSDRDFEQIAAHRCKFKGGLSVNKELTPLVDTKQALLLHEIGVAKDSGVSWEWSYYKIYKTFYKNIIDSEDLDFYYDNRKDDALKVKGENGYISYALWIPVDTLQFNDRVNNRYSNIIRLIEIEASHFNVPTKSNQLITN